MPRPDIRAAGGVLWRPDGDGGVEVLLVHRDRYDDWTFPKGKLRRGEKYRKAARREVKEETGFTPEVGDELVETRYIDHKGRDKKVRYWAMTVRTGQFRANSEVDAAEWMSTDDARERLTYERDADLIDSLLAVIGSDAAV